MATEKKTKYSYYLQNAVGKGTILCNSKLVPRYEMGYHLWGHIHGSGNASPVAVSIVFPMNMTVRLFGKEQCSFICAGGRTEQTTLLGLASICVYLSVRMENAWFQLKTLLIRNKLHTTKANNKINLLGLQQRLCKENLEVVYTPSNFPGLSIHFVLPGTSEEMTATVFKTGAINLAGCRDSNLACQAYHYLHRLISPSFGEHVDQREEAAKKYKKACEPVKGQRRKPGGNTAPRISSWPLYKGQKAESIKNPDKVYSAFRFNPGDWRNSLAISSTA